MTTSRLPISSRPNEIHLSRRAIYARTTSGPDNAEHAAAEQYAQAAQSTLEAWKAIAQAHSMRGGVNEGRHEPFFWVQNLRIPGSQRLEPLRRASRENDYGTFLAFGEQDAEPLFWETQGVLAALQAEIGDRIFTLSRLKYRALRSINAAATKLIHNLSYNLYDYGPPAGSEWH